MLVLLTLAGVGLGVHFGRAAVNDIDPFYFTDPQGTHSYAALTPQGIPDPEPVDIGRFTEERELVRRYAHYPVSEQEREAHLLAVSAVLEDDQPAAEYGIAREDEPVENRPGY